MTPEFARDVDPVFLYVLDLLDRIEQGDAPDASSTRARILDLVRGAESKQGKNEGWLLAKYGLVAWIDEVLIEAPWEGASLFTNNSLQFELFGQAVAFTKFYLEAERAKSLPKRDALEVFYVCVVLGFRGVYRMPENNEDAVRAGLPADLATWAAQAAGSIRLKQGRPSVIEQPRPGRGARPLYGKFNLLGMSLGVVCMLFITVVLALLYLG